MSLSDDAFAQTHANLVLLAADALEIEQLDAFVEQTNDQDLRDLAVATATYQRAVARLVGAPIADAKADTGL